uniref:Uncharacterized protein n=1 Tax=Strigamia maritima TaxID=126957 RepID=T1IZK4_STRMM
MISVLPRINCAHISTHFSPHILRFRFILFLFFFSRSFSLFALFFFRTLNITLNILLDG